MDVSEYEVLQNLLNPSQGVAVSETMLPALTSLLSPYGYGGKVLREIASVSLERARDVLNMVEGEMYYWDMEYLRQELDLVEDEQAAATLADICDEPALEAHAALYALLPPEAESTQRRRRVLALALAENYPIRAAALVEGYRPNDADVVEFWGGFTRSLYLRLKEVAPLQAIDIVELPFDAHSWLLESLTAPDSDPVVVQKLVERVLGMEMPIELPLPDTKAMIDALYTKDIARRTQLLCLLAQCGSRPVDDRMEVLKYLLHTGISLPEAERAPLVEAVRKEGVTYLKTEHRREVLKRLAHLARHCRPEIQREIRILRAIALLEHLSPRRLAQAPTWVMAYDRRFRKRLLAVQREREELLEQILILLKRGARS